MPLVIHEKKVKEKGGKSELINSLGHPIFFSLCEGYIATAYPKTSHTLRPIITFVFLFVFISIFDISFFYKIILIVNILFGPFTGNSWRTTIDIGSYFESWVNNIDQKY